MVSEFDAILEVGVESVLECLGVSDADWEFIKGDFVGIHLGVGKVDSVQVFEASGGNEQLNRDASFILLLLIHRYLDIIRYFMKLIIIIIIIYTYYINILNIYYNNT